MNQCWSCSASRTGTGDFCRSCGSRLAWHDWHLIRELGSGGSGTAYLVERQGKRAVLKIPAPGVSVQAHQIECRNLYIAASLNVAPAPLETAPDGLLMEYLPVPTGMTVLERARRFLGAVNRLHNRDLVHRDIKPENVIGWQLIDLGAMVDLVRDDLPRLPAIGTPGYAAPEAYRRQISRKLDAYACGWVLVEWLGGPEPDPSPGIFGFPQGWVVPDACWRSLLEGLLEPDPHKRLSVGQAYHQLCGEWCTLSDGSQIGSDLVTVKQWTTVLPGVHYRETLGYATELDPDDVQRYLAQTGTRLPTLAELAEVSEGTSRQPCLRPLERMLSEGLVSDLGARNTRRFLWQPTNQGMLWGGTAYADQDQMLQPTTSSNATIGLRVKRL